MHDINGVKSWLNRIVYTLWQDTLRRRQRRIKNLFLIGERQSNPSASENAYSENAYITRLDIRKVLGRLSEEHRAVVVLVSMLGYGYEEVSEILEIPKGTVASRVARARSLMVKHLKMEKKKGMSVVIKKEVSGE